MTPDRIEAMVELSRALKAMLDADAYLESNIAARDYDGCEEGYVMRDTAAERLDKALRVAMGEDSINYPKRTY